MRLPDVVEFDLKNPERLRKVPLYPGVSETDVCLALRKAAAISIVSWIASTAIVSAILLSFFAGSEYLVGKELDLVGSVGAAFAIICAFLVYPSASDDRVFKLICRRAYEFNQCQIEAPANQQWTRANYTEFSSNSAEASFELDEKMRESGWGMWSKDRKKYRQRLASS